MPYNGVFNANEVQPQQGGGAHPVGNKFPFTITGTEARKVKDKNNGLFEVEFTSPAGSIKNIYNLWNDNDTAVKIAKQELSALCHAVGIFMVDFNNDGVALRGGKGLMDVNFQKGHEPSAEKPQGGYVEVKKVYDLAGNEPGKGAVQQPQTSGFVQQAQPQQQVQPQQNQPQPQVQQGWTGQQTQAQPQPNPPAGGWQQGGNAPPANAPWGQ